MNSMHHVGNKTNIKVVWLEQLILGNHHTGNRTAGDIKNANMFFYQDFIFLFFYSLKWNYRIQLPAL